jgi:hypothetical protein
MYAASTPTCLDYGLRWDCDVIDAATGSVANTVHADTRDEVVRRARTLARKLSESMQPSLFDGTDELNGKAHDWICANPSIWRDMCSWARSDAKAGERISMKDYTERARKLRPVAVGGFGIDNRITAPLARYLSSSVPEARPLIHTRRSISDVTELPPLPRWLMDEITCG